MPVNVNHNLSTGLEAVGAIIGLLLLGGLLFSNDLGLLYASLFLSVFFIILAQVSGDSLLNHLQSTCSCAQPEDARRNRFEMASHHVGKTISIDPKAVHLVLLVMMHFVVLIGFFRLYTLLSREKGFL